VRSASLLAVETSQLCIVWGKIERVRVRVWSAETPVRSSLSAE